MGGEGARHEHTGARVFAGQPALNLFLPTIRPFRTLSGATHPPVRFELLFLELELLRERAVASAGGTSTAASSLDSTNTSLAAGSSGSSKGKAKGKAKNKNKSKKKGKDAASATAQSIAAAAAAATHADPTFIPSLTPDQVGWRMGSACYAFV